MSNEIERIRRKLRQAMWVTIAYVAVMVLLAIVQIAVAVWK